MFLVALPNISKEDAAFHYAVMALPAHRLVPPLLGEDVSAFIRRWWRSPGDRFDFCWSILLICWSASLRSVLPSGAFVRLRSSFPTPIILVREAEYLGFLPADVIVAGGLDVFNGETCTPRGPACEE